MIHVERDGYLTSITIDRPKRRNALNWDMIEALGAAIAESDAASDCHCIVVKGAAGQFCAGRDLDAAGAAGALVPALEADTSWTRIFHLLHRASTPTVSVVRGFAVAGGFTLAMACDFVLAERDAQFGAMEMQNGFPAAINTPVLSKLVGPRLALEMLVFGDLVNAERLYEMGLINRLASNSDDLTKIESEFVGRLLERDPHAIALTKESHRATVNMPLDDALAMGKQLNTLIAASGRLEEAARSFAAKQKARK
jgi:enoyl-CoA hydratase